jgi:rod shape-determining protein MreD
MRIVAFYLVLLAGQGLLSAAFGTLPAPDLFVLAMLTLLGRLVSWQLVLLAYAIGMLQDVIGFGVLGLHAIALAAAALAATVVRMQLSGSGMLERLMIVVAAQAGKWLVAASLLVWLSGTPEDSVMLLAVSVTETVLTAALALLVLPWADALLNRAKMLPKELL